MRRRLAVSLAIVCSLLAFAAFFYLGKNREVENRAYYAATKKAIYATAQQRGTTYAAVVASTGGCYQPSVTIDREECASRILYADNLDGIWRWERFLQWLELPLDIALAFAAGFLSVYLFAGALHLIRDRWLPWIQGR